MGSVDPFPNITWSDPSYDLGDWMSSIWKVKWEKALYPESKVMQAIRASWGEGWLVLEPFLPHICHWILVAAIRPPQLNFVHEVPV